MNVPNVREFVQQSIIPVYGVTENFLGLKLVSVGKSFVGEQDGSRTLSTISVDFSVVRAHFECTFNLVSYNNKNKVTRDGALKMLQPLSHPFLNADNQTLRHFGFEVPTDTSIHSTKVVLGQKGQLTKRFLDQEKKQVPGLPIESMEIIALGAQTFTAVTHHWQKSPWPAWFLLYNDDELFFGQAFGFTKDELSQILQHCTVVNSDEQIIRQYQQELDQHVDDMMNELKG